MAPHLPGLFQLRTRKISGLQMRGREGSSTLITHLAKSKNTNTISCLLQNLKKKTLNSVRIHVHCCNLDYFTSPNEKQESKHCVLHQTQRQQYSHLSERLSNMNAAIQASHFKVGSRGRSQVRRAVCGFQDPYSSLCLV